MVMMAEQGRSRKQHLLLALSHISRLEGAEKSEKNKGENYIIKTGRFMKGGEFFYFRGEKALEIRERANESKLKTEAKLLMH